MVRCDGEVSKVRRKRFKELEKRERSLDRCHLPSKGLAHVNRVWSERQTNRRDSSPDKRSELSMIFISSNKRL
jgi:hypothetical protein